MQRPLMDIKSILTFPLYPLCVLLVLDHPWRTDLNAHEDLIVQLAQTGRTRESRDRSTSIWKNEITITIEGDIRIFQSNGLPDHPTGRFPRRGNPHRISAQNYEFRTTMLPAAASEVTSCLMNPFGIAVNGVLFDPWAQEFWRRDRSSGWRFEALSPAINLGEDDNNAHVQPDGTYHYHGLPTGLLQRLTKGKPKMVLVGWAADGFPIYGPWGFSDPLDMNSPIRKISSGYQLREGNRSSGPGGTYDGSFVQDYEYVPDSGDLDECNGRIGMTDEYPDGIYHYYLTEQFPFIPRKWKGTPDPSFLIRRGPAERRPRDRNTQPSRRRQRTSASTPITGNRILASLDTNGNRILEEEEIKAATEALLKLDRNGDGRLTVEEY